MDALVEAHDADELQRAMQLDAPVIGINARDLSTFAIDRRTQLELVARAPRDRLVIAESGVHTRAQGAAAELAGADAILVGSALMQARRPAGETARAALAAAREGVRADAAGRRRRRGRGGRRPARLHPRRARARGAPTRCSTCPRRRSRSRSSSRTRSRRRADLIQFYPDDGGSVRGREATLLRDGRAVARVLDQPWQEHDPAHWSTAAATDGRVVLAGGLGPENVRDAIAAVQPWAVDASSSLEREPGVKDHERVRAYVEAARA